jgi:hypothetical protein
MPHYHIAAQQNINVRRQAPWYGTPLSSKMGFGSRLNTNPCFKFIPARSGT